MIFTFVIALIAGALTPMALPHIKTLLEKLLLGDLAMAEAEFQTFGFALMMLAAALLALLAGASSAIALALGGLLGLFGTRIWAAIQNRDDSFKNER